MITLKELWIRCCTLIEEKSENSTNITDDEDIRAKLPIFTNQGIKAILQVKPILKFATLPGSEAELFGEYKLYKLPSDLYQLKKVHIDERFSQLANGNDDYIKIRKGYVGDISIEYSAFHEEIMADSPTTTKIMLTPDAISALEFFVCKGLILDDKEMFSYFFSAYNSAIESMSPHRSDKLISFE